MPGSAYQNDHPVKFNLLQRLMRQWEQLYPFNGAHAVKISGALDLSAARRAWEMALSALGLGALSVTNNSYAYRLLNGEADRHTVEAFESGARVWDVISDELNRPYDADAVPFRPFAIQEEGHFWLGLGYRHFVADSVSIRMLMREWFLRLFEPDRASNRRARLGAGGFLSLFGPHRANWDATPALLETLRLQHQIKRARRIEDREAFGRMPVRFELFDAPDGLIETLYARARSQKMRVNDLFLAAIAEACDRHEPSLQRSWKRHLVVETMVDLRPRSSAALDDVFDVLLGFSNVSCTPRELKHWDTLLSAVCRQTKKNRERGVAESSWLRMLAGLAVSKFVSRERLIEFYRKRLPTAAAISNVNMTPTWVRDFYPHRIMEYVRASPVGPSMPVIFTPTTLGPRLSLGMTYRESLISPERAAVLAKAVMDRLNRVASAASARAFTSSKASTSGPRSAAKR